MLRFPFWPVPCAAFRPSEEGPAIASVAARLSRIHNGPLGHSLASKGLRRTSAPTGYLKINPGFTRDHHGRALHDCRRKAVRRPDGIIIRAGVKPKARRDVAAQCCISQISWRQPDHRSSRALRLGSGQARRRAQWRAWFDSLTTIGCNTLPCLRVSTLTGAEGRESFRLRGARARAHGWLLDPLPPGGSLPHRRVGTGHRRAPRAP